MRKFSFVILNYKNTSNLVKTLESLNCMDGYSKSDYEAVVVDLSPNTSVWRNIKSINQTYDLQYVFLGESVLNRPFAAKNKGWKASNGEVVIFINPGVIVGKDYLHQLDKCYGLCSRMAVIGLTSKQPPEKETRVARSPQSSKKAGAEVLCKAMNTLFEQFSYNISHCLYPWLLMPTCNIAVHRDWLKKLNGFDEKFRCLELGAKDMGFRLQSEGGKIIIHNKLEICCQNSMVSGAGMGLPLNSEDVNYFYTECSYLLANIEEKEFINILKKTKNGLGLLFEPQQNLDKTIIDLHDRSNIDSLKKLILESSIKGDREIIVNDYLEDSDLDVWIQLLGRGKATPKYYPASRKVIVDIKNKLLRSISI